MVPSESIAVIGGGIVGSFVALTLSKDYEVHWVLGGSTRNAAAWGSGGLIQPGSGSPFSTYPGALELLRWIASKKSAIRMSPSFVFRESKWLSAYAKLRGVSERPDETMAWQKMAYEGLKHIAEMGKDRPTFDISQEGVLQFYTSVESIRKGRESVKRASIGRVKELGARECLELEPGLVSTVAGGLLFQDDIWTNPAELLDKMRMMLRESVTLHEGDVKTISTDGGGRLTGIGLESESLKTNEYIFAAGASLPNLLKKIGLEVPIVPAWGHMIRFRPTERILHGAIQIGETRMVIAQTRDLTLRASAGVELGFCDQKFGPKTYTGLKDMASAAIPKLASSEVIDVWSGMRPVTPDGLPIIGRSSRYQNLLIAAGHGRLGVTLAPGTGRMVADLLSEASSSYDAGQAFNPARFGL